MNIGLVILADVIYSLYKMQQSHGDHLHRLVKGIFVIREWPNFFPVKSKMACFFLFFFLINRDFISSREP